MIEDQVPEILASLPTRISDVVNEWAFRSPEQPALVESSGTWTYRQLSLAVADTQNWLVSLSIRPGDRVMIVCENCRAFIAIFFALTDLGAWPVLVNARLSARELAQIREHSGARRVIYTTQVSPHAAEHAKRERAEVGEFAGLGVLGIGPLNDAAVPEPLEPDIENRVAALIYTSGTTGMPKGVMLSHRNLLFVAAISARIRSLTPADRLLGVLPMTHAVGLSVVLLGTLLSGATLFLWSRFDPMAARKSLETDKLTVVLGTPAMFALLLDYAKLREFKSLQFPALRIISSSGAPLDMTVKSGVENLFGMVLHNGYGVTECSPTLAQTRIEAPRSDISVGRVFPGVEIKLVGPDRKAVAPDEQGELWVRGPNVMKGYYRAPQETTEAIDAEGWFNTRDLARLENGNLFIVGRTKELIVRFGFNVYPAEVEAVLNAHPSIARSAVVGRSVGGNEEVVAFVELQPGLTMSAMEVAEYSAQHLAPYKRPTEVVFVPTLPVTPTGKVRKDELTKMLANGSGPK
jgi:long-chain acyl-CoA synthetase